MMLACWQACRRRCPLTTLLSSSSFSSSSPSPAPSPSSRALRLRLMHAMSFLDAIATINEHLCGTPPPSAADNKSEQVRLARFQTLFKYIETLDMEGPLERLSVIHVAGTKGKGSTCAFTESILRSCGYRTALFTSPHLVDIRERFRFNGTKVSEEVFAKHFWWCWGRLQAASDASLPMPGFFPFLTLLALKMFTMENVDVAILEVGLGGRLDTTNVVRSPVVCGVASLGFDHMEVLGNTLAEIAGEKAGIFKAGVPAFSVPQKPEAMDVLEEKARRLSVPFGLAPALDSYMTKDLHLGLEGDHQRVNAALALALCAAWERRHGAKQSIALLDQGYLPDAYVRGLATTSWPGRGQVIHDKSSIHKGIDGGGVENGGVLKFYLDGAHSPESMEACGNWFCSAVSLDEQRLGEDALAQPTRCEITNPTSQKKLQCQRVLLFNCMPKRDPDVLLEHLVKTCKENDLHIEVALFVPPFSSTRSIDTRSVADIYTNSLEKQADLSWQKVLQKIWESLQQGPQKGSSLLEELGKLTQHVENSQGVLSHGECTVGLSSAVMPSLPAAIEWLRQWVSSNPVQLQVLVTGSLYLVGDLLKILHQSQGPDT